MSGPKAAILLTVYRRYHELEKTLQWVRENLPERPVFVVWACPEPERLRFFQLAWLKGQIAHVLTRERLPEEHGNGASAYPESHNLRMGLAHLQGLGFERVLVLAADCRPTPKGLKWILEGEALGKDIVAFWCNAGGIVGRAYQTNCFSLRLKPNFLFPLSPPHPLDMLEVQFFAALQRAGASAIVTPNHNNCMYAHSHDSEGLPPFPETVPLGAGSPFKVVNRRTLLGRVYRPLVKFFRRLFLG